MTESQSWSLLSGRAEGLEPLLELKAGDNTVALEPGDIRYFRSSGHEIVRRIYAAVRNVAWETPKATVTPWEVSSREDGGFDATYRASVSEGDISFEWTGKLELLPNELRYSITGQALSSFAYARIGLCVLHPPSIAGCSYRATTSSGTLEGQLPRGVGPQPLIDGEYLPLLPAFSSLDLDLGQNARALFEFEGDEFEFEDQRNWLDASYKSYSTPMSLGVLHAEPGQQFFQQVRVAVTGLADRRGKQAHEGRTRLELDRTGPTGKMPTIGLGVASGSESVTADERVLLNGLGLGHLRVDLHLGLASAGDELARAAELALFCGTGLEIAIFVEGDADRELAAAKALTDQLKVPIRRFLIFGERSLVTPSSLVRTASRLLVGPAPVFGGTNIYFAELNRDRPDPSSADGFAFSVNAQVHAADDRSLMEAPQSLAEMLRSAKDFLGDRQLAVTPITLLPRFNPDVPEELWQPTPEIPPADHRQASLLCAAWTLECAVYLAEGAAGSATFFETSGERGVIANPTAPTRVGELVAGAIFPVYHVFAALTRWAGRTTHHMRSSDPLAGFGIACSIDGRLELAVANATAEELPLELTGLPSGPATARILDTQAVSIAWGGTAPSSLFGSEKVFKAPFDGLSLPPYAVAFITLEDR